MNEDLLARSGLSLERLRGFRAFADSGSLIKAAGGDPVGQSLISRQIRELEEFFETELVRRKGKGLELTNEGKRLAALVREHFRALEDFTGETRGKAATVSLVAPNSVAQWIILPRLPTLMASLRGARFAIFHDQTREIGLGVSEGLYDFGFLRQEAMPAGLDHAVLGRIRFSLFVPRKLAKATARADAIFSLPLALQIEGQLREDLERIAAAKNRSLDVRIECNSYLQALRILQTERLAVVGPSFASAELDDARFFDIPLPAIAARKLCMIWNPRNAKSRPVIARAAEALADGLRF